MGGHGRPGRATGGRYCAVWFVCIALAPLLLLLAGCATPATKTETVEVKVPVAIQPITPAQVPKAPAPLPKRPNSLSATADLLLSDHCAWVAFGLKAMPLLLVSAGLPITPLPKYPECEGR